MGLVPIQELEVVVEDKERLYKEHIERTRDRNNLLNSNNSLRKDLDVATKNLEDYSRRTQSDIDSLTEQLNHTRDLLETATSNAIAKENQNVTLVAHVVFIESLLKEEREVLKATQDMIYLRTGMKREVFPITEGEQKEVKPQHSGPRTRSQIKVALEERAARLMKEQKEREAEAITKGDLPPTEVTH